MSEVKTTAAINPALIVAKSSIDGARRGRNIKGLEIPEGATLKFVTASNPIYPGNTEPSLLLTYATAALGNITMSAKDLVDHFRPKDVNKPLITAWEKEKQLGGKEEGYILPESLFIDSAEPLNGTGQVVSELTVASHAYKNFEKVIAKSNATDRWDAELLIEDGLQDRFQPLLELTYDELVEIMGDSNHAQNTVAIDFHKLVRMMYTCTSEAPE